ncbi:uncharacterized protein FA14DRAFT_162561 [Meira miltonrushii]|uniref:Uncharacterized protein n=1 Tax=Meira miltonrushii TaxID=1280837 RepID=A0A316V1Z1_9BASI|nr:uncharacterized protein FA14DRAFT_162561 [Meira miltonrushii]PWN31570.1 hypothetical protein FA14DRAFT_162561 [Meira miltonrushii]
MNFSFQLLLAVWLYFLNIAQESKCFPLPTQFRLEKRGTRLIPDGTRFRIAATRAQAAIYKGASKISYASGAGKAGKFLDKAAAGKSAKVKVLGHQAQTKAIDATISI